MSTPETPESPQLTRRQLRELRNTASSPIITPEEAEAAAAAAASIAAPLPRAAAPVVVSEEPPAAEDVDLRSRALTRRAARQQERLRRASVPVVDAEPESAAADEPHAETAPADGVPEVAAPEVDEPEVDAPEAAAGADEPAVAAAEVSADVDAASTDESVGVDVAQTDPTAEGSAEEPVGSVEPGVDAADPVEAAEALADVQSEAPDVETVVDVDHEEGASAETPADGDDDHHRPTVAPTFGSGLLAGEGVEIELPASFDQLLSRGSATTGSLAASNALILSQTPDTASFSAPVAATGEVLITGTFNLPESFASTGTSRGSSDGKEIDAVLVDGELPASSSPTPIAASSAISTIKSADDIIKPPAPEKGGRLMLALVITAGALALALTGALIVALVTGVFQ
ncbi:hypothetical protein [Microbacterium lacticum]